MKPLPITDRSTMKKKTAVIVIRKESITTGSYEMSMDVQGILDSDMALMVAGGMIDRLTKRSDLRRSIDYLLMRLHL